MTDTDNVIHIPALICPRCHNNLTLDIEHTEEIRMTSNDKTILVFACGCGFVQLVSNQKEQDNDSE